MVMPKGGVAEYEDIVKAFGKTQAFTEMWAAIGKKKGFDKLNIDSQITGNKVEVRAGNFANPI